MTDNMRGFVKFFISGLAKGGVREPIAYLYNGVRLADIYKVYTPEVQKTHPYAYIFVHKDYDTNNTDTRLWFTTTPLYKRVASMGSGNLQSNYYYTKADGQAIEYMYDWPDSNYVWSRNSEGDFTFTADTQFWSYNAMQWANTDVPLYSDNTTVALAASEPEKLPTYNAATAAWETLYEDSVTLTEEMVEDGYGCGTAVRGYWFNATSIDTGLVFRAGDVIRLTFNGAEIVSVAAPYLVTEDPGAWNVCYVGNFGLYDITAPDDGFDVVAINYQTMLRFFLRELGTYNIKLERMVT